MTTHYTVVIRCNTSVIFGTLCHTTRHLLNYHECYGFERAFFTLRRFLPNTFFCFLRLPWGRQFNLKLTGLHADPQNIVPAQLFVWITTIQKRFICGRFCLRVKGVWSRNINLYRALILWKISFTEALLLKFTPLTGFELSSQQVSWYKSLVISTKP